LSLFLVSHAHVCKLIDDEKKVLCIRNELGKTPLHLAVQRIPLSAHSGGLQLIYSLIDADEAVLMKKDADSKSPYEIFRDRLTSQVMTETLYGILQTLNPKVQPEA